MPQDSQLLLETSEALKRLVVRAAGEIWLSQQAINQAISDRRLVQVPEGYDLEVYGFRVGICGELRLAGRNVRIVAHEITWGTGLKDDQIVPPAIDVSGTPGTSRNETGEQGANGADGANAWMERVIRPRLEDCYTEPHEATEGGSGKPGADGSKGGTGNPAGNILLVSDLFTPSPSTVLTLRARGGRGGKGGQGGKGGTGGKGGDAVLHPHSFRVEPTKGARGGPPGQGGQRGPGGDGGNPGSVVLLRANADPAEWMMGWKQIFQADIGVGQTGEWGLEGDLGDPGTGGKNFPDGSVPDNRGERVQSIYPPPQLPPGQTPLALPIQYGALLTFCDPQQFALILAEARFLYLVERFDASLSRANYLIAAGAWFGSTANVSGASPADPYLRNAANLPPALLGGVRRFSPAALRQFERLHKEACLLQQHQAAQLDYFGHAGDYVPLLHHNEYIGDVKTLVEALATVRALSTSLGVETSNQTDRREKLAKMQLTTAATTKFLEERAKAARSRMETLHTEIVASQDACNVAREPMKAAIVTLKKKITDHFECPKFEDILHALEMTAFVPPVERKFLPGGAPGPLGANPAGLAMAGIELAGLISKGFNELPTVSGLPEDKQHFLRHVSVLEDGIAGLKSGYQRANQLYSSAPSEALLVADIKELQDALAELAPDLDGVAGAKEKLEAFTTAITARNGLLMRFNEAVLEIASTEKQLADLHEGSAALEAEFAAHQEPAAAELLVHANRIGATACDALIHHVYLAARALSFWGLEGNNLLANILGQATPDLVSDTLAALSQETLKTNVTNLYEVLHSDPTPFPQGHGKELNPLIYQTNSDCCLKLDDASGDRGQKFLKNLRTTGTATLRLTLREDAGVFPFKMNVRLAYIRLWLLWPAATGNPLPPGVHVCVHIKQLGPAGEEIQRRDESLARFTHDAVDCEFRYDPHAPESRPAPAVAAAQGAGDPATIQAQTPLLTAANDQDSHYGRIGPFASWRFKVTGWDSGRREAVELDLRQVAGVLLEFHGQAHASSKALRP